MYLANGAGPWQVNGATGKRSVLLLSVEHPVLTPVS